MFYDNKISNTFNKTWLDFDLWIMLESVYKIIFFRGGSRVTMFLIGSISCRFRGWIIGWIRSLFTLASGGFCEFGWWSILEVIFILFWLILKGWRWNLLPPSPFGRDRLIFEELTPLLPQLCHCRRLALSTQPAFNVLWRGEFEN